MQNKTFCISSTSHIKKYPSLDQLIEASSDKFKTPIYAWLESCTSSPPPEFSLFRKKRLENLNSKENDTNLHDIFSVDAYLVLICFKLELSDIFCLMKTCKKIYALLTSPRMNTILWERFLPPDIDADSLAIPTYHYISCQRKKFHWKSNLNYIAHPYHPMSFSKELFLLPQNGWIHLHFLLYFKPHCVGEVELGITPGTDAAPISMTIELPDKQTNIQSGTRMDFNFPVALFSPYPIDMALSASLIKWKTPGGVCHRDLKDCFKTYMVFGHLKQTSQEGALRLVNVD